MAARLEEPWDDFDDIAFLGDESAGGHLPEFRWESAAAPTSPPKNVNFEKAASLAEEALAKAWAVAGISRPAQVRLLQFASQPGGPSFAFNATISKPTGHKDAVSFPKLVLSDPAPLQHLCVLHRNLTDMQQQASNDIIHARRPDRLERIVWFRFLQVHGIDPLDLQLPLNCHSCMVQRGDNRLVRIPAAFVVFADESDDHRLSGFCLIDFPGESRPVA